MYSDVIVIIPSRLSSERLPRKPLAEIGDMTMIEHVATRVLASGIENVYVATDSDEIAKVISARNIKVIMTDSSCPTGTDRVYQAFQSLRENKNIKYIINIQGDMPFIDSVSIVKIIDELRKNRFDIITPVAKVGRDIADNLSNAKVVVGINNQALYFSRSLIPYGAEEYLYHVGIYGFKKEALTKFVNLTHSKYERVEKLEQLRALENGMTIGICYSDAVPISVDTEEDLAKARHYASINNNPGQV